MKKLTIATVACALLFFADPAAAQTPSAAAVKELAGTGKVRVAFIQPGGGAPSGVGLDVGKELAERVGVPFEPVVYQDAAALLADARSDKWDAAILVRDPARAVDLQYTRAFQLVENPGVRYAVGVPKGRNAAAMFADAAVMAMMLNGASAAK